MADGFIRAPDLLYHARSLRPCLERVHVDRLKTEHHNHVMAAYRSYLRRLPPAEWSQCPPGHHLELITEFKPFFKLKSVTFTPERVATHDRFSYAIEKWRTNHLRRLSRELRASLFSHCFPEETPLEHKRRNQLLEEGSLNLAIAVFSCYRCVRCTAHVAGTGLFGWEDVLTHLCGYQEAANHHTRIAWSSSGYGAVVSLLEYLDLDPWTTTVNDLDQLDARFFGNFSRTGPGHKAMTWRECVSIHLQYSEFMVSDR